jgi:hypothetical protein
MSPDDGEFGRYDTTFYFFFFLLFITNNRSLRRLAEAVLSTNGNSDPLRNGAV